MFLSDLFFFSRMHLARFAEYSFTKSRIWLKRTSQASRNFLSEFPTDQNYTTYGGQAQWTANISSYWMGVSMVYLAVSFAVAPVSPALSTALRVAIVLFLLHSVSAPFGSGISAKRFLAVAVSKLSYSCWKLYTVTNFILQNVLAFLGAQSLNLSLLVKSKRGLTTQKDY